MYKVGDKFIIEIEESCGADGFSQSNVWGVKGFSPLAVREETLNLLEKYAPSNTGYEKGLSDAWECMKKILDMTTSEQRKAFNTLEFSADDILEKLSPQEAIDKLKAWEEKQEIKVGDYIISNNGTMAVVQRVDSWGRWECLTKNGQTLIGDDKKQYWKKTGNHIDLTEIFKGLEG